MVWLWCPPSPEAPREEKGPCGRGGHFESGHSGRSHFCEACGVGEATVGWLGFSRGSCGVPSVLQGAGGDPPTCHPDPGRLLTLRQILSLPPSRVTRTAAPEAGVTPRLPQVGD